MSVIVHAMVSAASAAQVLTSATYIVVELSGKEVTAPMDDHAGTYGHGHMPDPC